MENLGIRNYRRHIPDSYWQIKNVDRRLLDLSSIAGKRVLDVGCGTGIDLLLCDYYGGEPVGIDIDIKMIKKAGNIDPSVKPNLLVANAFTLPFRDDIFDIVFSFSVLDHIRPKQSREIAVREMARVTKPGGFVIITGPNLLFLPGTLFTIYARYRGNFAGYEHRFTPWELEENSSPNYLSFF
jgi:ubiquinone/menaquinone biosynthesis C-methylase UbiE